MAGKLKYLETYTPEEFKEMNGGRRIKLHRNATTGKFFFTCGSKQGALPLYGIPENPMVSLVQNEEEGSKPFWMIHNEGGAEVIGEL